MERDRSEIALTRIEAALARINAASAKIPVANPNVMSLVNKHEALREEVASTMRDLDKLIEELEQ